MMFNKKLYLFMTCIAVLLAACGGQESDVAGELSNAAEGSDGGFFSQIGDFFIYLWGLITLSAPTVAQEQTVGFIGNLIGILMGNPTASTLGVTTLLGVWRVLANGKQAKDAIIKGNGHKEVFRDLVYTTQDAIEKMSLASSKDFKNKMSEVMTPEMKEVIKHTKEYLGR